MFNPRVASVLRRQHGAIGRAQALRCGMSVGQIGRRIRDGALLIVLPKVYAAAEVETTTRQMLWAAWLYAGPTSLLSHSSAALLWQVDAMRDNLPELWVPAERNTRSRHVRIHRTASIRSIPRRSVEGLRTTSPERTVIDLAPRLGDVDLEWVIEQLRNRRLLTPDSVRGALERSGRIGRPGAARLGRVLGSLGSTRAESLLEVRVNRLLRSSGLPNPERQLEVKVDGQSYRLDFAWSWRRVALECDGRKYHSDPAAFSRDRERWTHLGARLGYRIVYVTWDDVETRPTWIVEQIASALR